MVKVEGLRGSVRKCSCSSFVEIEVLGEEDAIR